MTHKEYADSLRLIADFFESHTDVELPFGGEQFEYFNASARSHLVAALGSCKKEFDSDFPGSFTLVKHFGTIEFRAIAQKSEVCTKKIIGTRHIPERIIRAHDEEIVEWDCHESILRDAEPAVQTEVLR